MSDGARWEWDGSPSKVDHRGRKHYQRVRQVLPNSVNRVFRLGDTVCLAVDDDAEGNTWVAQLVDMTMEPSDEVVDRDESADYTQTGHETSKIVTTNSSGSGSKMEDLVNNSPDEVEDESQLEALYARMRIIVRWFYAYSDVPPESIKHRVPSGVPAKKAEYYFTDHVEKEPNSVDLITGRAHMFQSESEQRRFALACKAGMFKKNQYIEKSDKILVCTWFCCIGAEKYANGSAPMRLLREGELEFLLANPSCNSCFQSFVTSPTNRKKGKPNANADSGLVITAKTTSADVRQKQATIHNAKEANGRPKKAMGEVAPTERKSEKLLGKRKTENPENRIRSENAAQLRQSLVSLDSSVGSNIAKSSAKHMPKTSAKASQKLQSGPQAKLEALRLSSATAEKSQKPLSSAAAKPSLGNTVKKAEQGNCTEIHKTSALDVGAKNTKQDLKEKTAKKLENSLGSKNLDSKFDRKVWPATGNEPCLGKEQQSILRRLDGPMNKLGVSDVTDLASVVWNVLSVELESATEGFGGLNNVDFKSESFWQEVSQRAKRRLGYSSDGNPEHSEVLLSGNQ